jgi:predicted oxidoreductase
MEPEEIAEAFSSLHKSGKVRKFGVSNMNPQQIDFLQDALKDKLLVNQLQFSAAVTGMVDRGMNSNMTIEQSADRDGGVLDYCRRKNITIQTWSPLQYGFFGGIFLGSEKYPELNAVLDRLAQEKGVTPAAIAIAWILRHPAHMQVILGSTNLGRVSDMAKAADIELSRPEWYEIYLAAGNKLA